MSMSLEKMSLSFIVAKDTQLSEVLIEDSESSDEDVGPSSHTVIQANAIAMEQLLKKWDFREEYPFSPFREEVILHMKSEKIPSPSGKNCSLCKEPLSVQWRRGPYGKNTLCNACGIVYSNYVKDNVNYWERRVRMFMSDENSINGMLQKSFKLLKFCPSQELILD